MVVNRRTDLKPGTRVRYIGGLIRPYGTLGTIIRRFRLGQYYIDWDSSTDNTYQRGYHTAKFEVVEPDLKTMSDEEVAAEYRKAREESRKWFNEVISRGYSITIEGAPYKTNTYSHPYEVTTITIKKTVLKEI